jgi:ATP-dependent DNA helicase HFM1/MER3
MNGKGAIIFCSTRKFASGAARYLFKMCEDRQKKELPLPWIVPRNRPDSLDTEDPDLEQFYTFAIGFHHAGLAHGDRRKVENAFLQGHLSILCSTSSLAVGVNLPAFLVIIRGTQMFDGKEVRDYSDLDVFQMMGRAGRPQFDTEGICAIMTDQLHKDKWADLIKGESTVESTLHYTLIERANAEIVFRRTMSVRDMQEWLRKTFFYVRLRQKPVSHSSLQML